MLKEAAELDADTFLVTSRLLNERVKMTMAVDTDHVVKVRESVRKAVPKGGASVSVNVSVEVRQLAEQLAKSMGVSADELIADAEAIAAGVWDKP
jgi:predicted amino acid-binding ACT domain protein